jgi:hypothetical protein
MDSYWLEKFGMNKVKVSLLVAAVLALTTAHLISAQAQSTTPSQAESETEYEPLLVIPAQRPTAAWSEEHANRSARLVSSGFRVQEEVTPGSENQENGDEDAADEDAADTDDSQKDNDDLEAELEALKRDMENDDLDDSEEDVRKPRSQPFGMWPKKSIREVRVNIQEYSATAPADQSGQLTNSAVTTWASSNKVFAWTAPNIRYQPLYFEDIALERYGQTQGAYRQSIKSAARFVKSAVALPYAMTIDAPGSCDGPLGFCRPGSQTSCVKQIHFFSR